MTLNLKQPFAVNAQVNEEDVRLIKRILNRFGYYTLYEATGMTNMPDASLFAALKKFQADNGLKPDGDIRPGDETMAALNKAVQNQEKSHSYIWHTVGDDDVRNAHRQRNGKVFSWNKPPEGGHPAEDYNCRCWAEILKENPCARLAEHMRIQLILIDGFQADLAKAIDEHNVALKEWQAAEDNYLEVRGDAVLEVAMSAGKGRIDLLSTIATIVDSLPKVIEARELTRRKKTEFTFAQEQISYLEKRKSETLATIDSIKKAMQDNGCRS